MAKADDLVKKEKELTWKASQLDRKEREILKKEKNILALEKKLRKQSEMLRSAEKKILSREKKLQSQERKLEGKEAKLVSKENKVRDDLARIFTKKKRYGGKAFDSLKKIEAKKRSELSRILSKERVIHDKEDALLKEERRLGQADGRIREKEIASIAKLDDLVSAEKKLEELSLNLERDHDEVLASLEQVRRMRGDLHLKGFEGRVSTGGWGDKPPSLKPGNIYLIDEHDVLVSGVIPSKSIELFKKGVGSRVKGLYVTRSNPRQVEGVAGLKGVDVLWMTDSQAESSKYSTVYTIEHLSIKLTKYLTNNPSAQVLLEGLEYMMSNMGFEVVLPFIQSMRDYVSTTEAVVIVPINSEAFNPHELSMLARECYTI